MDFSRYLHAVRQGCVDPFAATRYWKDSPSPPPAPDYSGAAQATAAGNIDAARLATKANRTNQYTPYGNLIYTQDPTDQDKWSSRIDLSPVGEQLLNANNQSALGLAGLQSGAEGRVASSFAQPFDQQSVQDTADRAYSNYTARLDPQWQQQQAMQETQLRNQGLVPGSEAYDNAMRVFNNAKNDAYTSANTASISTMPQTMQLAAALRNQPLNELNALRTGSQVTNPQFTNAPQQQQTTGPNMLGAAQAQGTYDQGLYNAGVGQANAFNSGLFSLAGSAVTKFSDRRLKSNIVRIGEHPIGIGIYEYDIFGRREIGVMADEVLGVLPAAVSLHPSGFMQVDYGRL